MFRKLCHLLGPASMAWERQGVGKVPSQAFLCLLAEARVHTHHQGWLGPLNPPHENQVQIK